MKNLFKFFILTVLAVCGVACGPLGGDDNGGNGGNGGNPTIKKAIVAKPASKLLVKKSFK